MNMYNLFTGHTVGSWVEGFPCCVVAAVQNEFPEATLLSWLNCSLYLH